LAAIWLFFYFESKIIAVAMKRHFFRPITLNLQVSPRRPQVLHLKSASSCAYEARKFVSADIGERVAISP
jgi:hypothetical protein